MVMVEQNPYLEQEVMTASPAKLRWLLINKAVQLSRGVEELWQNAEHARSIEWTVWLRDVLNELLAGIHGSDEIAKRVSDLYIFMLKLLTEAELTKDVHKIHELVELLEIESETWMMLQRETQPAAQVPIAPPQSAVAAPIVSPLMDLGDSGSLCLDA